MADSAQRRLQVLGNHLAAGHASQRAVHNQQNYELLFRQDTAASTSTGTPYASVDGKPNSYARIHGPVSREPAQWRKVPSVAREELTDVIYEKAIGEGIAKASGVESTRAKHLWGAGRNPVTPCCLHLRPRAPCTCIFGLPNAPSCPAILSHYVTAVARGHSAALAWLLL